MKLAVGSCFSGIGGIELGLEWTGGFETKWQIEINDYASKVLAKHWPGVKRYGDIRSVDPSRLERVDLICGGYPCQPFSLAGERRGESDPRHLWPDMFRLIRHLRPRYLLLENVPGHLSLGFGRVLGDLAEGGYDAEWGVLSAAGVGAPHLRRRVFIIAHTERAERRTSRPKGRDMERKSGLSKREENSSGPGISGTTLADPSSLLRQKIIGCQQVRVLRTVLANSSVIAQRKQADKADALAAGRKTWEESRGGNWWSVEPGVDRVASRVPFRVDRLRCLGNAVVPQVAQKVSEIILDYENRRN